MAAQLELSPLMPNDPVKIGSYWLKARLLEAEAGIAFIGFDKHQTEVMIVQLNPKRGLDPITQSRLAILISRMHADTVIALGGKGLSNTRFQKRYCSAPKAPQKITELPWVALSYQGQIASLAEAKRILSICENLSPITDGPNTGPDFQEHQISYRQPWIAKLWPLPWPDKNSRAGILSILSSWLLMLLIMLLALVLAIIAFQHATPATAPKPIPSSQNASGTPKTGSASPSPSNTSSGNSNKPPRV